MPTHEGLQVETRSGLNPLHHSHRERGLTSSEVRKRQETYGPNSIGEAAEKSNWRILVNQFRSLLTLLLAIASLLSFLFGDMAEGLAILVVILLNTGIGFWAERKAGRSMAALRRMGRTTARVRRDGETRSLPADQLVPGDIVILDAGDIVPADLQLLENTKVQCDESLLTGESVPVDKLIHNASQGPASDDRSACLFKGTAITRGSCTGLVRAIGRNTELGEIADLAARAKASASPLEKRLQRLSEQLLVAVLLLMIMLTIAGIVSGLDSLLMVKTGIALAVAAIPQGLPVVATLTLARSMWKLAARNALIERLSAVETLGSITLIISDKTGTLTENRMTACALVTADCPERCELKADGEIRKKAGRVCGLCYSGPEAIHLTDPMEKALVDAAASMGCPTAGLEQRYPRVDEEAFDPDTKMMATVHQAKDRFLFAVKGAPEAVLEHADWFSDNAGNRIMTDADRQGWLKQNEKLAGQGLRVLALAEKVEDTATAAPYEGLVFIGLIGLKDPPRSDVPAAVEAAQKAGVRIVMATGDSPATAANIAESVGLVRHSGAHAVLGKNLGSLAAPTPAEQTQLLKTDIFARMTPKQKLDLIDFYQRSGEVVAMTGDGVNDAPALKKADVGVAMGVRGTEVAKEAAAMILKDDAFASIVVAIQQGRVIFSNIRKLVIYLLSCNLSEILVITAAILAGLPLPLLPLQILFLNLVTDVFPALALGFGRGDNEILERPPRPKSEGLIQPRHWQAIVLYGVLMTVCVTGAYLWALQHMAESPAGLNKTYAGTVAFLALALGQLWHVFNMRSRKAPLFRNQVMRNPYVWTSILLCLGIIASAIYSPLLADILSLAELDAQGWAVVSLASLTPLLLAQVAKSLSHRA